MRYFIKNIYYSLKKIFETILQFVSILLFTKIKYIVNLRPEKISKKKLLILGNGPSLSSAINEIINIQKKNEFDFICVNEFAFVDYYKVLKPQHYVLIDPIYFKETPNNERVNNIKNKLLTHLLKDTEWRIKLYIPRYYVNSSFIKTVENNKNIQVVSLNNVPLFGGFGLIKEMLFYYNLGNPVWQNVLIAAIFLGIQKNYKTILLFGADHSWFNNLKVLVDNSTILNDIHIDNSTKNLQILTDEIGNPKKLHVFIQQMYITFREYHVLNKYAEKNGTEIVNITKNSFIDAFKKTTVNNYLK
jgi:hypothetical protein